MKKKQFPLSTHFQRKSTQFYDCPMTMTMVFAISTPTSSLLHTSSSSSSYLSNSAVSVPRYAIFHDLRGIPKMGSVQFSQWDGLKQLGISTSHYSVKMERKGRNKGKGIYASLFGVGAPEALVIGVVALLVFGPKGLAEVARNLGKTLRSFQPTIRELQEVSREIKSSLEREIGLDEIDNPVPRSSFSNTPRPTPEVTLEDTGKNVEPNMSSEDSDSPSESGAYTADEYLKVTEAQLKGARARLQKEQEEERDSSQAPSQAQEPSPLNIGIKEEDASQVPPGPSPKPES